MIPDRLGDLSRAYAAAARQKSTDPTKLGALLDEIDALVLDAYALPDEFKRDIQAAIGESERPIVGPLTRRRRLKKKSGGEIVPAPPLPLFSDLDGIEVDIGEDLGEALSANDVAVQLRAIAHPVSIAEWAGEVLPASELVRKALIGPARLDDWVRRVQVISFKDERASRYTPLSSLSVASRSLGWTKS